jgi:hypothetical protein
MGAEVEKEQASKVLAGDILVGASIVDQMAKFAAKGEVRTKLHARRAFRHLSGFPITRVAASQFDSYADNDIPFADVDKAAAAAERVLAELPREQVSVF